MQRNKEYIEHALWHNDCKFYNKLYLRGSLYLMVAGKEFLKL